MVLLIRRLKMKSNPPHDKAGSAMALLFLSSEFHFSSLPYGGDVGGDSIFSQNKRDSEYLLSPCFYFGSGGWI